MQVVKWSPELTEAVRSIKKSNPHAKMEQLDELLEPYAVNGEEKQSFVFHYSKFTSLTTTQEYWQS